MTRFIFILLCISFSFLANAQERLFPFTIDGQINADTGTVILDFFYQDFYPETLRNISAKVENGRFTFEGSIPYPLCVLITYERSYRTDDIIIDPGKQNIRIDVNENRKVPKIDNKSMNEHYQGYTLAHEELWTKRKIFYDKYDSLRREYKNKLPDELALAFEKERKGFFRETDNILLAYTKKHSESYVAFWKLIRLSRFSYEEVFDSVYASLSDSLRHIFAGRVLKRKLDIARELDYGRQFPFFSVLNPENTDIALESTLGDRYTFLDFWYSNCSPCIAQFPHLKETYSKYRDKGFEVVGISTDKESYEDKWMEAIVSFELTWPQYWDKEGVQATRLSIYKFPTNFLLDAAGNIVEKDLRPVELDEFLLEHLK